MNTIEYHHGTKAEVSDVMQINQGVKKSVDLLFILIPDNDRD